MRIRKRHLVTVVAATVIALGVVGALDYQRPGKPNAPAASSSPGNFRPPGALNPDVTQDTIGITICVANWTDTIRPPASYTNALKVQQIKAYGLVGGPQDFEEDHLVPLSLGGAPRDARNLWPEPWPEARRKDVVESRLHREVCAGTITLAGAQDQMRAWRP